MAQAIVDGRIVYPPEFNPLIASRPRPPEVPFVPDTKFVKAKNPIPGHYIVVLNDDAVPDDPTLDIRRTLEVRMEQITSIANGHAQTYGGRVGFIYHAALKGYSIELPTEGAAIALSENAEVRWVEPDGISFPAIAAPAILSLGCTYNITGQKDAKNLDLRHPR
jgi:hypothetical protein